MTYILAGAIVSVHPVLHLNVTEVNSAKCSLKATAHRSQSNYEYKNDMLFQPFILTKKNRVNYVMQSQIKLRDRCEKVRCVIHSSNKVML